MARNLPVTPAALPPRSMHGVWGSCHLSEGPWLVWLPWEPLIEDSAEMTGWGSGCFPASGLVAGCSGTSEAFLVTREHYGFISRTWLCPRFQLRVPWSRMLWALRPSSPWPKGPRANLPCPPLMEEFPVPRLSSALSFLQERADQGTWVGLDHTSHRAYVWKLRNLK